MVDELLTNRYYAKLLDIHFDYNRISSISILEGSHWLAQCRVLSLKGNNLTKVRGHLNIYINVLRRAVIHTGVRVGVTRFPIRSHLSYSVKDSSNVFTSDQNILGYLHPSGKIVNENNSSTVSKSQLLENWN